MLLGWPILRLLLGFVEDWRMCANGSCRLRGCPMQVILLERIEKLGQMGDIVTVKNGFGRNYLRTAALRATKTNLAGVRAPPGPARGPEPERKEEATALPADRRPAVVIIRQAGEGGQLYGSVNARDIAAVHRGGRHLQPAAGAAASPLKTLGIHHVRRAASRGPDHGRGQHRALARGGRDAGQSGARRGGGRGRSR